MISTKILRPALLALLLLSCTNASLKAFQTPLKLSQLYLQLMDSQEDYVEVSDRKLIDDINTASPSDAATFFENLAQKTGRRIAVDSIWLQTSVKALDLYNVTGSALIIRQLKLETFRISRSTFRTLGIRGIMADTLSLDSVQVESKYELLDSQVGLYEDFENRINQVYWKGNTFTDFVNVGNIYIGTEFWVHECTFKNGGYLGITNEGGFSDFSMWRNVFEPIDENFALYSSDSTEKFIFKTQFHVVHYTPVTQWSMDNNIFQPGAEEELVHLEGEVNTLLMKQNDFGTTLVINTAITKHWGFGDNVLRKKLDITDLVLLAKNNELSWGEIADFKMAATEHKVDVANNAPYEDDTTGLWETYFKQATALYYDVYYGETDEELANEKLFQELISSYYRLYKVFKENGQVKDANQVYVEMKDVELRELSFKWKNEKGFENWINWRLNRLLRFYTDYGTNPSKAINISVFVLLIFAVFYFFFPSEWDTKSKGQLILDYRTFVDKNDKGYVRPFIMLSLGFSKSLLNALTLSLNSFITLGFGTIPTTGLARYVCILQGFLGWFLLSIFTASLINQVMF